MQPIADQVPNFEAIRATEQARLTLESGRVALPKAEIDRLLIAKWEDPIRGILGAHLLLLEKNVDVKLFRHVTANLDRVVGEFADVQILRIWADKLGGRPPLVRQRISTLQLKYPPMLAPSWRLLDVPWMSERITLPEKSISSRITNNLWGQSVWLLWCAIDESMKATTDIRTPATERSGQILSQIGREFGRGVATRPLRQRE